MRPTVAAALMSGGGLILLATLSIDYILSAGSVMLLASTFVAGAGSHPTAVLLPAPLAVGSIMSAGIMAMNPVFGVGYTYAPVGAGALLGGILHVVASSRIRARGTGGTLKSP